MDEIKTIDNILKENNIDITVATVPMITTQYNFKELLHEYDNVFTLEEHFETGGFGSILSEYCNNNDVLKKINKFGIKNEYIHKIGDRDYLRKYYKIDAISVAKRIMEVVSNG